MANMEYPRRQQQSTSGGPGWTLFCAIFALALGLLALPWILIGLLTQRLLSRWLHWRLSFLIWVVALFVSAYLVYVSYQHGLQALMTHEFDDYILAAKHYQADLAHWPLKSLWADTLPVWLHSWQSIGIVGFAAEVFTNRRQDTAQLLRQGERQRQRRIERSQRRARRRTSQPQHVSDAVGGMMVMGIAIDDQTDLEI